MDNERSELRWGFEQTLELVEFHLFWEGHMNRSDLMKQFRVSVDLASTDLNSYISLAPDNVVYDKSARTYVRCPAFMSRFLELGAHRYLAQLCRWRTGSSTARIRRSSICRPLAPRRRRSADSLP